MGTGKKKIEIKKIEKHTARMVTFSKRRKGLFKKAQQYAAKTNSQVALLVFSPAGRPFVHGSSCFDTVIDKFMNENNCRDGVTIGEKTLIEEIFNDKRSQEGVWIDGECVTSSGGGGGGGRDDSLIEEFWNGEWGQEDVWTGSGECTTNSGDGVDDDGKTLIEEYLNNESGQEDVWIDGECVTNCGGGGGENDVAEMFSWLENRMRRCESTEELMELRTVLENMKDKAMKRLKYMQEDNFVASLFSSDSWVSPTPPDQTLVTDQLLPHQVQ